MDQLMRFLFKHERAVFTNGHFSFDARPSLLLLVLAALLLGLLIYHLYLQPRTRLARPKLFALIALRSAFFIFIILLLLRPVMVVPSVIPRSSRVALLADDSQSMQLTDEAERRSRLEAVRTLLADPAFRQKLEERFRTELYAFSRTTTKIAAPEALRGEGTGTDLAGALDEAAREATGGPLSAVVLFTDGAANSARDLASELRDLRARGVPVYTVGAGSPDRFRDAELLRVNLPRRVLVGSSFNAEILVRLSGYDATKVMLSVREDGRTVKTREFELRGGGEAQAFSLELTPAAAGTRRYTFTLTPLEDELTLANNSQEALVEAREGPARVLYLEGEPRWEHGKMRTSVTRDEKNLLLVSMLRSGDNKFYRQGIDGEGELASGFPKTPEELFSYQGLILGSVEASFFTPEQIKSIEAFVARRGGGLLALGGRFAFDGGKYASTAIADLLPFYLDDRVEAGGEAGVPAYKVQPTTRGRTHPITRFDEDAALNQKKWDELPLVTVPEILTGLKPGATVLLEARRANGKEARGAAIPLLAEERYGRGRTIALAASDTWRWQMKLDSKNNSHETFWRQMLRHLVSEAPDQLEVTAERDVYAPGDTVRLIAEIRDKKYEPVRDARAAAVVTKPSGATLEVPLEFTSRDDLNHFTGEFPADELGQYHLELKAGGAAAGLGQAAANFLVGESSREFSDATQNVELLRRIATETGGKYYPLARAGELLGDLTYRESANSERVSKELWDMPFNFFLLIGLISAEWFLRKREGLA